MHIAPLVKTIQQAFSGEAARRTVAEIARHHRIQASPGYRAAAQWLAETAQQAGLSVSVERYPAKEGERFWTLASFPEWECRAATLTWLHSDGEEHLANFRASAVSVIQRSAAVQGEFEVIDVGEGKLKDYEGVNVRGKLVLSRTLVRETYRRAVVERGAAGVLYDHITGEAPGRSRTDLADARQYSSFWWSPADAKSWGFVLTPRQGDRLREALRAGDSVKVRAQIDARFYDGEFEAVAAAIPGQGEGRVLSIAHLCHPQGFANDNASGAACLLETAITLQHLIDSGQLPQPDRTITFLWIPEMTGTYAWLQAHEAEIPGIVAGLNLDMVGENQEKTGSVMLIDRPPEAMASFAPDLLERLRDELLPEQASLSGAGRYATFRYATTPFSGGSDHMITSDPAVGIPTPMIIQWPDRFYHTTIDTLDKVDPKSLQRAGALAGSYLVWLATAGAEAATWLGWEMVARFEQRLSAELQAAVTAALALEPDGRAQAWVELEQRAGYRLERAQAALQTLRRLGAEAGRFPAWQTEIEEITDRLTDRARRQIRPKTLAEAPPQTDAWHEHAAQIRPVRLYRGPIMDLTAPLPDVELNEADAQAWRQLYADVPDWRLLRAHAEYWTDGRRSLAEIARLVELETGRAIGPAIETYFRLLQTAGAMHLGSMIQ